MIDVIIPAYNCEKTLDRTLSSFVCQTDKDFKIYLIDDCSTQDIKTIVDRYNNLLDITYIRNEHNVGCGMSRQVGIDNSHSNYFMFCDSDDIVMPYTIAFFNDAIKTNDYEIFRGSHYTDEFKDGRRRLREFSFDIVRCHGVLYNREVFKKYNVKNQPQYTCWSDDSYINGILNELCNVTAIDFPVYYWTQDNLESLTHSNLEVDKMYKKCLNNLRCAVDVYEHVKKYRNRFRYLGETIKYQGNVFNIEKCKDEEVIELYNKLIELYNNQNMDIKL